MIGALELSFHAFLFMFGIGTILATNPDQARALKAWGGRTVKSGLSKTFHLLHRFLKWQGYDVAALVLRRMEAPNGGYCVVTGDGKVAQIHYTAGDGNPTRAYVPFDATSRRHRAQFKVFLRTEEGLRDITQEPGLKYVVNPRDLGGSAFYLFKSPWNAEFTPSEEDKAIAVFEDVQSLEKNWPRNRFAPRM